MSARREPAAPPALAGFTHLGLLGSGGFADVFLYEQQMPRRKVAVKVLLAEHLDGGGAATFTAEANVMAQLSTHPAIVTIYQAGISDDARPYLVMEYCPRPNLQARYRAAPFSVAEALRVGVQVAAAVETAHRAGILHRDIKPANILVTEYNRPALTDFGIAATGEAAGDTGGMSIPWSPPEAFAARATSTPASDVWSLGATVYTLLAGRSPFEKPGGRNGAPDLIARIEREPLPPLERDDVPVSLRTVLERAMAKDPAQRQAGALDFARALQRVQIELALSVTPVDILDDSAPDPGADDDENDELTRVRGIVSIEAQTAPAAGRTHRRAEPDAGAPAPADTGDLPDETLVRPAGRPAAAPVAPVFTVPPPVPQPAEDPPAAEPSAVNTSPAAPAEVAAVPASAPAAPRSRRGLLIGLGVAAAAAVVVGGVVTASVLAGPPEEAAPTPTTVAPQNPVAGFVPAPADATGEVSGGDAVFTWTNPDPQDGDSYLWQPVTLDGLGAPSLVETETLTVPADAGGRTCIEITLRRDDGAASDPTRVCAP